MVCFEFDPMKFWIHQIYEIQGYIDVQKKSLYLFVVPLIHKSFDHFVSISEFSTTADPISGTLVSNKCICGNEILSNATVIKKLEEDLNVLQQQISFLNRSIWSLNHSKTAIGVSDDMNNTMMGVLFHMRAINDSVTQLSADRDGLKGSNSNLSETVRRVATNIMALNGSITDVRWESGLMQNTISILSHSLMTVNDSVKNLLSDSVALKGSNSNLNETVSGTLTNIMALNDSIMVVKSDTMALKASMLELNDSQLVSSSMYPGWPDAIACNHTGPTRSDDRIWQGIAVHYLSTVEEPDGYVSPLSYTYRWIPSNKQNS